MIYFVCSRNRCVFTLTCGGACLFAPVWRDACGNTSWMGGKKVGKIWTLSHYIYIFGNSWCRRAFLSASWLWLWWLQPLNYFIFQHFYLTWVCFFSPLNGNVHVHQENVFEEEIMNKEYSMQYVPHLFVAWKLACKTDNVLAWQSSDLDLRKWEFSRILLNVTKRNFGSKTRSVEKYELELITLTKEPRRSFIVNLLLCSVNFKFPFFIR